jgi:hypothetical protein
MFKASLQGQSFSYIFSTANVICSNTDIFNKHCILLNDIFNFLITTYFMHPLHDEHEMNTYRAGHVCLYY